MVKGQGSWPGALDGNVCSGAAIPASLGPEYAGPSLHPQLIALPGLHILRQTHTQTHTHTARILGLMYVCVKSVKGA